MAHAGLACVAAAAVIGCAAVRPPVADQRSDFSLRTATFTVRATLEGDQLFGRGVDVVRGPGGYRGRTGQRLVHLSARGDHLVGFVGEERADLTIEPLADGIRIRGSFGGEGGSLAVTDQYVVGRIGTCVFDFHRAGGGSNAYLGRSLDWDRGWLQLELPTDLGARPAQERAAFATFFLLQLCGQTSLSAASYQI
jgi:hypothetical protein